MSAARYQRLRGKGRRMNGTDLLLLADDHLLLARRHAYRESYRRFFFSDIQAFTLRDSPVREILAAVLAALLLPLVWALWVSDSTGLQIFWATLALGLAAASLFNWLAGPGVRCHLTTALQTVELTPLRRRPRAERVLGRLTALIQEAQTGLASPGPAQPSPIPLPERPGDDAPGGEGEPRSSASTPAPLRERSQPPPLPATYAGTWHWLLFGLLLVDSAVTLGQQNAASMALDLVGGGLFLVELAVGLAAILRQRVFAVAPRIKALTWTAMGFMLLLLVASWALTTYSNIAVAFEAAAAGEAFDPTAAARSSVRAIGWVSMLFTTTIGLAGLAAMSADRRLRASSVG